ncbi:hypothetical protein FGO68_gene6046 [Halteria grandinella]|uniref:Uncharacterized protein n=1 Tax=Halteria grandinella TaxID=5974 RepID=A0A8J8NJK1_HALGN|nr:hypothetical protein FGO68_gene6046 [Halteria grandinella]
MSKLFLPLLSILLFTAHGADLGPSLANRCYSCLFNNTSPTRMPNATTLYFCGGLNRCFNASTDLNRSCTYNATDWMECPMRKGCITESWKVATAQKSATPKNDWIIINEGTNGQYQYNLYEIPPQTRCQFAIVNALFTEQAPASFKLLQDISRSYNHSTNASLPSASIRPLKLYTSLTYNSSTLILPNKTSSLQSVPSSTNQTVENGNFTYVVVVNDSPDQRLGFTVMYSQSAVLGVMYISIMIIMMFQ